MRCVVLVLYYSIVLGLEVLLRDETLQFRVDLVHLIANRFESLVYGNELLMRRRVVA